MSAKATVAKRDKVDAVPKVKKLKSKKFLKPKDD